MPFIDCEGARVFWRTDGHPEAPALVLANSLGSDISLWDDVVPALATQFHVIRLDLPGHGASSVSGERMQWSVAQLADQALKVADAAGAQSFDFIGVSVGGMIGLHLAANTARVRRLVVSNSAATHNPQVWTDRIRAAQDKGLAPLVDGTMQRWFSPGFLARNPPRLATIREHFLQVDPRGYVGVCGAIRDLDLVGSLRRITAPTLVISGANDAAMPPGASEAIAGGVAQGRHLQLPVAHIPHVEDPGPFTEAVLHHLRS